MATSSKFTSEENKVLYMVVESLRELNVKFDRLSAYVQKMTEETRKTLQEMETKMENNLKELRDENDANLEDINRKLDNCLLKKTETTEDKILSELSEEYYSMPEWNSAFQLWEESINATEITQEKRYVKVIDMDFCALHGGEEKEIKAEEKEVNFNGEELKSAKENRTAKENTEEVKTEELMAEQVNVEKVKTEDLKGKKVKSNVMNEEEFKADQVNGEEVKTEEMKSGELKGIEVNKEEVKSKETILEKLKAGEAKAENETIEEVNAEEMQVEEVMAVVIKVEELEAEQVNVEKIKTEEIKSEKLEGIEVTGEKVEKEETNAEEATAESGEVVKAESEEVNREELEAEKVNGDELEATEVKEEELKAEELEGIEMNRGNVKREKANGKFLKADEVIADDAKAEKLKEGELEAEEVKADEVNADELEVEEVKEGEVMSRVLKDGELEAEDVKAEKVKGKDITTTEKNLKSKVEILNRDLKDELKNEITPSIKSEMEMMLPTFMEDNNIQNTDNKTSESTITEEIKLLIQLNKESEFSNLEQNGFNIELYKRLKGQQQQMDCFTLAENKSNFEPDLTWKISGIRDKMQQLSYEVRSEGFKWSGYPVKARAKILVSLDGNVRMSLRLEKHCNGAASEVELIPHIYYVLRGQTYRSSVPKSSICRSRTYSFTSKFDYSLEYDSFLPLQSHLNNTRFRMDDCMVVEMYVEPPTMAQSVHSYNGTLNWAIESYRRMRQMAKERSLLYHESPYFYTGPKGYRVQVRMELDLSLSARVCFLSGEFDADLPVTFPHRATITLFYRTDSERNVIKTVEQEIGIDKGYFVHLCIGEEVENFVISDTLFYKVTIKALN